jgi:hypothetical protein
LGEDKDYLDTSKYFDGISIDYQRDYLQRHFLDLYQLKIKSREIIHELPKFKYRGSIRSQNWKDRINEEFEIFNLLKDLQNRSWTAIFRSKKSSKGTLITVLLSLTYPRTIPVAQQNVGDRHVTPGAKCFGDLKIRWDQDGSMGIPHFLVLIGYYYAIEKQSMRI